MILKLTVHTVRHLPEKHYPLVIKSLKSHGVPIDGEVLYKTGKFEIKEVDGDVDVVTTYTLEKLEN